MDKYWHNPLEMPSNIKDEVANLTNGRKLERICIDEIQMNLLQVDASTFRQVFALNREFLYHGDYTAPIDENDYIDGENYLIDNGLAGFSITHDGWLVSLFSNLKQRGFAKSIAHYIKEKAVKLVCISTVEFEKSRLAQTYAQVFGFKYVASTINDEQIMRQYYGDEFIDKFITYNGIPHHIFMAMTNISIKETKLFDDYFIAYEYVNSAFKGE